LKTVLITFSGIDGAGKSTQIEKLSSYLTSEGIQVQQMTFWDDVAVLGGLRSGFSRRVLQSDGMVGSPERPAQRRDKNTQSWPLLVGRAVLHVLDVINLRRIVRRAKSSGNGVIIFDRYIYDQLAALPLEHWLARAYARLVLRMTPKPDLSFLLDAVPEAARLRKPEYPIEFLHAYRNSYLRLRPMAGLQLVAAAGPEDVHLAILDRFQRAIDWPSAIPAVQSAVIA